jgi:hypothetical protein
MRYSLNRFMLKLLKYLHYYLDNKSHVEGDEPPVGPPASWLVEGRYAQKTIRSGRKTHFYFLALLIYYPRYHHAHFRIFGWSNI